MPEQGAETHSFGLQKFAELLRVHVKDFDALFGKDIADFRQGQGFGDFLIQELEPLLDRFEASAIDDATPWRRRRFHPVMLSMRLCAFH